MRTRLLTSFGLVCLLPILPLCGAGLKITVPEPPKEPGKSLIVNLPGLPENATNLEFVLVPGFGAVKPFLLGKYEITQGQYQALMATNPSTFKYGPNYPVEEIAWQDAKDFCLALNAALAPDAKARFLLRLPMDAEWSVAVGLTE